MEEDGEDWTPFWEQNTADLRRVDRFRHRVSSAFFSSGLLLILLLVTAIFFLVFVVPSTLTSQIFRPSNVKKSWDNVNIVLVLFALVFGFLSRNKTQESPRTNNSTRFDEFRPREEIKRLNSSDSSRTYRWYDDPSTLPSTPVGGGLRRTFSSYPDLRGGWSAELAAYNDDPWRFYDDTRVEVYRRSDSGGGGQLYSRRSWKEVRESQVEEIKNVVQAYEPSPPPLAVPSSPPIQPSPPSLSELKQTSQSAVRKRERRSKGKGNVVEDNNPIEPPMVHSPPTLLSPSVEAAEPQETYQSVARKRDRRRKKRDNAAEENKLIEPPRTPPPPPPPPPPPLPVAEQNKRKSDNKRSGASATKEFLNSFYHKKKKKQRQKSVENMDSLIHQSHSPALHFQLQPPSPPPPPPPSVFHNLFTSKKEKSKRTQTITVKTPIPNPASQPISAGTTKGKPSEPMKIKSFDSVDENANSGGESPFRSIPPPPPPPPPFYKPAWKFAVQGDYVRVDSISSESPDPSDVDSDATPTAAAAGGGGAPPFPPSPLFFPSPDVNTKAERFISRFRAGLKLEKMNSMKKHELGLSNLGPNSGPRNV